MMHRRVSLVSSEFFEDQRIAFVWDGAGHPKFAPQHVPSHSRPGFIIGGKENGGG
jgi:hypothetical protein